MDNVKWVALGELCTFENGDRGPNYPSKSDFSTEGVPFLNAGNIEHNVLVGAGFDCITKAKYESLRAGKVRQGDILFCLRGTIGKCAISSLDRAAIASSLVIIRCKPEANTQFIYYMLTSGYFQKCLANSDNGSVQGNISVDFLKTMRIPVPALARQEQIASILGAIDDKIANNKKLIAGFEETAQLIYDYWFTQFDFPDDNGRPYRSSGGKMVWNDALKREVPETWISEQLGAICITRLGGTPDTGVEEYWNGDMPWLSSAEIAVSPILEAEKRITARGLSESATAFAPAGSILLSITRYIRPSILAIDACFNQSVVAILESEALRAPFLYPFIQSLVPRYMALRTGAQQPHINKDVVDSTMVLIPSERVLAEYYDQVGPLFEQLILTAKQTHELTSLRDWLLPMLMNGQVTIEE